jgi:hypothetical protein
MFSIGNGLILWQQLFLKKNASLFTEKCKILLGRKNKKIRSRYGNEALEADDVMKHILRNPNDGNSAYMFVADQTPHISMVNFGLVFKSKNTCFCRLRQTFW